MPRKPTGKPNGRPHKEISLTTVTNLGKLGCTQQEVADFLGVSVDTLARREGFADAFAQGMANAKVSLRRAQFKNALAGNSRLQIWLGQQLLGQRAQASTELSGPQGGPIQAQIDLTRLSDDQLSNLESLLTAAQPGAGSDGDLPSSVN